MYFIDRQKIETQLQYLEYVIQQYEGKEVVSEWDRFAFERIATGAIESFLDVCNGLIDGFVMRDPGSYEDIVDIMEDERVIPKEEAVFLKEFVSMRKPLVQEYWIVRHEEHYEVWQRTLPYIKRFPNHARAYIQSELGEVVNAFLPS